MRKRADQRRAGLGKRATGSRATARRGPKYLPIYERLRARLEKGDFPIGSLLPKEHQLCTEYHVARYTLREALRALEEQGFIERKRRAGTRVLARSPDGLFRHAVTSRDDILQFVAGTTVDLRPARLIQTDGKLARSLGCDELRRWYVLEGVRLDATDRRPIGITRIYVDASRAAIPENTDFGHRPVYEWLENHHGIHAASVSQDISATLLAEEQAAVFGERPGAPALQIMRRYFDDQKRNFMITVTTHRSEGFVYNTRIQLER